jgi:hypothetical protein
MVCFAICHIISTPQAYSRFAVTGDKTEKSTETAPTSWRAGRHQLRNATRCDQQLQMPQRSIYLGIGDHRTSNLGDRFKHDTLTTCQSPNRSGGRSHWHASNAARGNGEFRLLPDPPKSCGNPDVNALSETQPSCLRCT